MTNIPIPQHPLIDIGANLADPVFADDLDDVITRAKQSGVGHIIVTGSDLASNERGIQLAQQYRDYIHSTVGLHPHHAKDYQPAMYAQFKALAGASEVKAIGEAGLDFYRNFSSQKQQVTAFEAQLELACETQLPLFLHEREAFTLQFDILNNYRDQFSRGVVHCFTGSKQQAFRYLDLGLYIGITGWICDERRGYHLHEFIDDIPRDRLLIETDAPYLMPRVKPRPKLPSSRRNEPCTLRYVLQTIAQHSSATVEQLAVSTTENAIVFFNLSETVI